MKLEYTIGDFEDLWVKIYVKEDKLGILKLGQRVEITSEPFPNKVCYGKQFGFKGYKFKDKKR